jgi:DNA invertase Pin-like site-specific DNA recombinase
MKRVALYLRVSTDQQTTENQRPEVEQMARQRGTILATYEEAASSKKRRPAYEKMLRDAKRGAFDLVVFWAIDRFGRSMLGNLTDITALDAAGVQVASVRETWMDTAGPIRGVLIAFTSWVAEQEHARLVERTKAGMATARRKGKRIGRPRRRFDLDEAARLRAEGLSLRAVAAALAVPFGVLQRALVSEPKGSSKATSQPA